FAIYSAELFAGMPEEALAYVPDMVRKRAIEKLNAQGVARHGEAEVYALGAKDVEAFAELLGDGPFLFGVAPTSFDASAFGVIGNLKDGPFASPVRDQIRAAANVAGYIDRIRQDYFGDL
ncbi:MAG: glutathione S-transferase C-terminal domain-containing protein, partial [Gammaproteobacteria bacterium]